MSEKEKNSAGKEKDEKQGAVAKMASLAIFILVLILLLAILFITYFFEIKFGKTAGTIALIVAAVIIAVYLYRKEIIARFKNR